MTETEKSPLIENMDTHLPEASVLESPKRSEALAGGKHDLKILSQEVLVVLYQLVYPANVDVLVPEAVEQKRLLLESIIEALEKVHNVKIQKASNNGIVAP